MLLLIPGPVTTRPEVRHAAAQDIAPWDNDFRPVYVEVRERVRAIAHGAAETHATLCLQGCGHFGVEAALRTFLPLGGRILVPAVGSYAERMARLASEAGRVAVPLAVDQDQPVDPAAVAAALAADPSISHVGLVHNETATGVVHDPAAIGAVVRAASAAPTRSAQRHSSSSTSGPCSTVTECNALVERPATTAPPSQAVTSTMRCPASSRRIAKYPPCRAPPSNPITIGSEPSSRSIATTCSERSSRARTGPGSAWWMNRAKSTERGWRAGSVSMPTNAARVGDHDW